VTRSRIFLLPSVHPGHPVTHPRVTRSRIFSIT